MAAITQTRKERVFEFIGGVPVKRIEILQAEGRLGKYCAVCNKAMAVSRGQEVRYHGACRSKRKK